MAVGSTPVKPATVNSDRSAGLHSLAAELFPICRSITGDGFRRSLEIISRWVPMERHEVPTGTPVLDWEVPREWNIRDAWIKNASGERVVDFQANSLHVLNYSVAVPRTKLSWAELRSHLHFRPDRPDAIPYRTSYYRDAWGFCVTLRQFQAMEQAGGDYEVCIDSSLKPGALTYGEFFHPGECSDEILFSCHACHPSLANDNLSGMTVLAALARELAAQRTRYSYRFLWVPGTIGAITWLARNEAGLGRIRMGLVVSCVGDPGAFTYKRSRRGGWNDELVEKVLAETGEPFRVRPFSPLGYDERQYCSPGFNLPVGCLMRTPNGEYPEYHTSADNLNLVTPAALAESLEVVRRIVLAAEATPATRLASPDRAEPLRPLRLVPEMGPAGQRRYLNLRPKGEPQLGRRGLYGSTGGGVSTPAAETALLWVLNFSDGRHSLASIAGRSGLAIDDVINAAERLVAVGLLAPLPGDLDKTMEASR